jgi:hypothetical protein
MMSFHFRDLFKKDKRYFLYFALFILLFVGLMTFVEIRNGKFWTNDLFVYVNASLDYFAGNTPYEKAYGLTSGLFKYPPTSIYFLWPMKMAGYFTIQLIHVLLSLLSFLIVMFVLHENLKASMINTKEKNYAWLLWLSFVFVAIHLVREFHMGNINLQLLALFALGWNALKTDRNNQTTILFSIVILFKPFMLLLIFPLFRSHWKVIMRMAFIGLLFFLFPLVFNGISNGMNLWSEWFVAVLRHGDYQVNHDSLSSLMTFYTGFKNEWLPALIFGSMVLLVLFLDLFKTHRIAISDWMCVLLALTPNLFKTDTQHFMFTLPLFFLLIESLLKRRNTILWIFFGLLMAGFSLNSNDLLGKKLGEAVTNSGILGLANLGLVILFIFLKFNAINQTKDTDEVVVA